MQLPSSHWYVERSTTFDFRHSGEIADAKTIMLLQWAAPDGPFKV